jgi:hypothetical protein
MNTDPGVIYVLTEHFSRHLFPLALDMEKRLDAGQRLNDWEIAHIVRVLEDLKGLRPLIDRHPEHHQFAVGVAALYADLARRAWHNETAKAGTSTGA